MKPTISSPGNRLAAARDVVHQVANTFDYHATVIFTAVLRRVAFLLKLLQRGGVLLFGTRLIKLRLQEVHHLIETDIPATNRRQQLVDIIEVVTRQRDVFLLLSG